MHPLTSGEIKQAIVSYFGIRSEDTAYQIIEKIRPLYIRQAEHLLWQVQEDLSAGNYDQLWMTARTMKEMGGSFGLAHFSSLCRELEVLAAQQAYDAAVLKADQLMAEFNQVCSALEGIRPA